MGCIRQAVQFNAGHHPAFSSLCIVYQHEDVSGASEELVMLNTDQELEMFAKCTNRATTEES